MKKNKTVAYMMAAALLIGGAGLGTKALFSDSAKADGNDLVITMGNLNVDTEESKWTVTSADGTEIKDKNLENNFENVKPGDTFEKTVTIKNEGSLRQDLKVTGGGIVAESNVIPGVEATSELYDNQEFSLAPGTSQDFKIKVKVSENMGGDYQTEGSFNKENKQTFNLDSMFNAYEIQANQTK
ncbi:hypothetical protein CHF27_013030 [Romboutsia maritimum]|uniref:Camelysin metallo-endopeptidase n=1 Tax=Romboutsia maritimum TaxID=2020948 RepID=A0A371IPV2_9FIRM|nr:hypothetical protein [Romboutsia maritimum]RDY22508.1 hypothetical protein CHF27_013030 [Romboutsia maritimum]